MSIKRLFRLKDIANYLTIFRCILGFPILIALSSDNFIVAWLLIIIGGITDFLDGWLARKAGQSSKWGAQADPLADKLMLIAPIIFIGKVGLVPLWAIWLIISREFLITAWRKNEESGGPANKIAKIKTSVQFLSIILLLWPPTLVGISILNSIRHLGLVLFWCSLFLGLFSAYKYTSNQSS